MCLPKPATPEKRYHSQEEAIADLLQQQQEADIELPPLPVPADEHGDAMPYLMAEDITMMVDQSFHIWKHLPKAFGDPKDEAQIIPIYDANESFEDHVMRMARLIGSDVTTHPMYTTDLNRYLMRSRSLDRQDRTVLNVPRHRRFVQAASDFCRRNTSLSRQFMDRWQYMDLRYSVFNTYMANSEFRQPWANGIIPPVQVNLNLQPLWEELTMLQEEEKVLLKKTTLNHRNLTVRRDHQRNEMHHSEENQEESVVGRNHGYLEDSLEGVLGCQKDQESCTRTGCRCYPLNPQRTDVILDLQMDIGTGENGSRVMMGHLVASKRSKAKRTFDDSIGRISDPNGETGSKIRLNMRQFRGNQHPFFANNGKFGYKVAVKVVQKSRLLKGSKYVRDEANDVKFAKFFTSPDNALKTKDGLSRRFFVQTLASFQTSDHIVTMTEFCSQGSLLDMLRNRGKAFSLPVLKAILRDVVLGVSYMQSKFIIHRNLCADNLLVSNGHVKITDFALARQCDIDAAHPYAFCSEELPFEKSCMAPEVRYKSFINGKYGLPSDMWDLGVLAYYLIFGSHPVEPEVKLLTSREPIKFPPTATTVCPIYLGLVESLLNVRPHLRPRPVDVQRHEFFSMDTEAWRQAWLQTEPIPFSAEDQTETPWASDVVSLDMDEPDPELNGRHYYHYFKKIARPTGFVEDFEV